MATAQTSPQEQQSKNSNSETTGNAPFTERAAETAHHTVDRLAGRAASAEDALRGAASQSAESIAAQRERLMQEMQTNTEKARLMIAKHPLAAAGVAFAAGVVIAAMWRR